MLRKLAIVTSSLAFITGCSTIKVDPSVYSKKRIAIVAHYGPKSPAMSGGGLTGSIQSATSSWTTKVLNETSEDLMNKLKRATGATFTISDAAPASAVYKSLPTVMGESTYTSYKSLRPLKIGDEVDAGMGKLASDLKVDGVMVISHNWSIDRDQDSTRPYATNMYEFAIFGADGKRVWYQRDMIESARADLSGAGIGMSILGGVSEKDAISTTQESTLKAFDRFVTAWNENKQ